MGSYSKSSINTGRILEYRFSLKLIIRLLSLKFICFRSQFQRWNFVIIVIGSDTRASDFKIIIFERTRFHVLGFRLRIGGLREHTVDVTRTTWRYNVPLINANFNQFTILNYSWKSVTFESLDFQELFSHKIARANSISGMGGIK